MAFHHQIHQTPATSAPSSSCCCPRPSPCHPYTPQPSLSTDPFVVAAIVAQLLQNPNPTPHALNPHDVYAQTLKPTNINRKQRYPHRETDQFQHPHSGVFNLLQRIDALEAALHRFSCSSSSSLSVRDAAARTIQTHFRAYLVRRSRVLGQLKILASIKSAIVALKSSLSHRRFVDFDFLSSRAMELLLLVDSIQGDDQMIRDSKKSITKEIDQFLDLLDGICVKRHQVISKTMRNMRVLGDDNRIAHEHGRQFSEHRVKSKCQNMSNDEKKLLGNLKKRAERIGRLSRELEDEEEEAEIERCIHDGEVADGDHIAQNLNHHRMKNGGVVKKQVQHPTGKKRVSFVEDGNVVRVYDIDENASQEIEEVEDSTSGVQDDEDEAWNHVEQSV